MRLLPYVNTESEDYGMDLRQDIIVASMAYFSMAMYSGMFCLEIYNVYMFLYKQNKYKVYPLTLFYALAVPCTLIRIFGNYLIVWN